MSTEEYLAIFQENKLKRSMLVRLLEKQIRLFDEYEQLLRDTEINLKQRYRFLSETTKWLAIEIAEFEKEHGELLRE